MPEVAGGVSRMNLAAFNPPMAPDNIAALQAAKPTSTRIVLVVGGANSNNAFVQAIDHNRAELIASIKAAVTAYGYAGVDINWEGLKRADPAQRGRFASFLRALRAALGPALSISVPFQSFGSIHQAVSSGRCMKLRRRERWHPDMGGAANLPPVGAGYPRWIAGCGITAGQQKKSTRPQTASARTHS